MILIKLHNKSVVYYNLARVTAYTLSHNKATESAVELHLPFKYKDVEGVMIEELKHLDSEIKELENVIKLTNEQKTDLIRKRNKLNYIINYENNKYDPE